MEMLHFIRPLWLLALPVIALVWWLMRRRDASQAKAGEFVAPHLREALTVNRNARRGLRAVDGVAVHWFSCRPQRQDRRGASRQAPGLPRRRHS